MFICIDKPGYIILICKAVRTKNNVKIVGLPFSALPYRESSYYRFGVIIKTQNHAFGK